MGLVKLDLAVVGLAEDAVEDDEVVMRVDVEGGAESRVVRSHRRRTGDVAGKSIPGDVPPIVRDFAQGRHSAGVNLGCSPLPPSLKSTRPIATSPVSKVRNPKASPSPITRRSKPLGIATWRTGTPSASNTCHSRTVG
jgi:hypothetical protein